MPRSGLDPRSHISTTFQAGRGPPGCRIALKSFACPFGKRTRARPSASATASPQPPPPSPSVAPAQNAGSAAGPSSRPPPPTQDKNTALGGTATTQRPAGDGQLRMPLVEAVRQRGNAVHEAPFHVPGHKRGAGAPAGLMDLVRPRSGSVLQYDLTEIAGLDFLSSPSGVISEAQQLAAAAFGADHTWFLVNGCSVGIHAAIMAATATAAGAGGGGGGGGTGSGAPTLVVARNCHLSAFSAMVLAGCEPYWVQPEVDPVFGVAHCVTHGSVREALRAAAAQGRRVVGVLIVSPTYFGAVADVEAIATVCHEYGTPLMVDEAHGGHFAFLPPRSPVTTLTTTTTTAPASEATAAAPSSRGAPSLDTAGAASGEALQPSPPPPPRSALSCGADVVIQSTHKVLGALTQAAMLHAAGPRVCPTRLGRALQTLQSSSPSYLLMASLDAARAQAAAGGAYDEACAAAQVIRAAVSCCSRIRLLDHSTAGSRSSVHSFDPLRLTLLVDELRLPNGGFQAAEWLERQYGVVPELSTARTVVLALGPGTRMAHADTAATAIKELDGWAEDAGAAGPGAAGRAGPPLPGDEPPEPEVVLSPRAAYFAATECVAADAAVGRVSSELLCPYPPGVPVVFPGERITAAALAALRATLAAGGAVTGARDSSLGTLQVVAT